jgi:hypothetical protein
VAEPLRAWILGEESRHETNEGRIDIAESRSGSGGGRFAEVSAHDPTGGTPTKGRPAGAKLVENATEGIEVARASIQSPRICSGDMYSIVPAAASHICSGSRPPHVGEAPDEPEIEEHAHAVEA